LEQKQPDWHNLFCFVIINTFTNQPEGTGISLKILDYPTI